MPRTKRKKNDNLPNLVVAHAAYGASLFYDEDDYNSYISLLRQLCRDRLISVFAFCLNPQEIRLILRPERLPLSRVIQKLHGSHTLRVNAKSGRHGTLFRSRYRSKSFAQKSLGSAVRSLHLWPVRAGLVKRPEFFSFSSHASLIGRAEHPYDFLETSWLETEFGGPAHIAQKAFVRYVESATLEQDDDGFEESSYDESPQDDQKHTKNTTLAGLAKRISLSFNINLIHLKGPSRRQDLVMARRLMSTIAVLDARRSVTEVAQFLSRDKAQISRLVSQGMDLLSADGAFRTLYESVWQEKE